MSLLDLLEADGHEVGLAFDGVAALAAARRLGPALDVLVTDLNMPHLGGEALIQDLRAERPGLPIVVVTGSPPPGGAEALQKGGGGHGSPRPIAEAGGLPSPPDGAARGKAHGFASGRRIGAAGMPHVGSQSWRVANAGPRGGAPNWTGG
ncbi:response regulator [Dankookia sp. P2]|uniref:response regulator n=1 Tax=Dankookia sp. P2 TaxID=3423955 RepID=UPI003D67157B